MPKKIPKEGLPESHDELDGFDIRVGEFGEVISTIPIDRLNKFLDENVVDKKLVDKPRLEEE